MKISVRNKYVHMYEYVYATYVDVHTVFSNYRMYIISRHILSSRMLIDYCKSKLNSGLLQIYAALHWPVQISSCI
jgi:hypothetical protein